MLMSAYFSKAVCIKQISLHGRAASLTMKTTVTDFYLVLSDLSSFWAGEGTHTQQFLPRSNKNTGTNANVKPRVSSM